MTDSGWRNRPAREQFSSRVRLMVENEDALTERYAANISGGGLFIETPDEPSVGSLVLLEFVLPDGRPLSRCAARIMHVGAMEGRLKGIGLQFVKLDSVAQQLIDRFKSKVAAEPAPAMASIPAAPPPPPPAEALADEPDEPPPPPPLVEALADEPDEPPPPPPLAEALAGVPDKPPRPPSRPAGEVLAAVSDKPPRPSSRPAGGALAYVPDKPQRSPALADRETDLRRPLGMPRLLALRGPVVGIDLGTINSCVATVCDGEPEVITSPGGYETIPSIVYVAANNEILVGHPARERMILEPQRCIYASKRFLGRAFASREVQSLGHYFPYELVAGPSGAAAARVGDRVLPLEEVSGYILRQLKNIASHHLDTNVQRAVITVPAYFGETQRQAVRDAGKLAGLYVERIINEPTASAVAYGVGRGLKETVLVYDLGGGTFDASVLRIDGGRFEVLGTDGDPFLGGADFDDRLTQRFITEFQRRTSIDLREQPIALQRVRFAAEMAKKQLSESMSTVVSLPFITQGKDGPMNLDTSISREQLESITRDLVDRTLGIVQDVLNSAQVPSSQLNDVLLVGGQSRAPLVHQMLFERFRRKPCQYVHPDEAVALGAAIIAHRLDSAEPIDLTEMLSASIRLGIKGNRTLLILPKGTRLPGERKFAVTLSTDPAKETKLFLYRGEAETVDANTLLGNLKLPGVSAGQPVKAMVTLRVTGEGLLSATAEHPNGRLDALDVLLL